jgi:cation diffusion facilitator CzcD-associated flavoprotein CzcO
VFQRTPSAIDARNNHPIDPAWFATLTPGWQRRWLENFCILQTGGLAAEDLVKDGWTDIAQRIRQKVVAAMREGGGPFDLAFLQRTYAECDDEKMTEIRARVDELVHDPATAQALKPWYQQLCKRPCFHDEYLQAYNLPTTHLIDTNGKGVERIDAEGVWVAGVHYPLDCLIFASGFEFSTEFARRAGFETTGRAGLTLSERWSEGMQSLHGMHVRGFPNLFIVGPAQGANLFSNITHNLTEAATSIAKIVAHASAIGAREVEVSEQAERAWVDMLMENPRSFLGNPECTPGYYNNEGGPIGRKERLGACGYPQGPAAYFEYIDKWRQSGKFEGLEFR